MSASSGQSRHEIFRHFPLEEPRKEKIGLRFGILLAFLRGLGPSWVLLGPRSVGGPQNKFLFVPRIFT